MSVLIFDPCAWRLSGHHFQFDLALAAEFERLGHAARIFCHRDASPEILGEKNVEGCFQVFPGKPLSDDPIVGDLETYLAQNSAFFGDLQALGPIPDPDETLLVFPNVFHHMLYGLAEWLGTGAAGRRPRLAIVLPGYSGYEDAAGSVSWHYALFRHAFNALRRVASDLPHLIVLSEGQVGEYTQLAGRHVALAPYPTAVSAWSVLERPSQRPEADIRRVTFLGGGGGRKGFDLLPEIVERVLSARPQARFMVQVNQDGDAPAADSVVKALLARNEQVELLGGYLDTNSFYRAIVDSDLILLPYASPMYRTGSSALFEEALYLGRPVVVPPDTALSVGLGRHPNAGIVAERCDAPAFAAAIVSIVDNYPRYAAGAVLAAAQRRLTSGMDKFARALVDATDRSRS